MAVSRGLIDACPGIDQGRLKQISIYLDRQSNLNKMMTPGAMSIIIWIGFTVFYWSAAGWFINHYYSSSESDGSSNEDSKNRIICIALIVYFSLCILIILFYAWRIKKFQDLNWDQLNPTNTFSGKSPVVTWGVMGFFTMGGLFISIILLCHYAGHDLHPALIVVLSLVALLISFTIALVGKVFVNCGKPKELFNPKEEACVRNYLEQKHIKELEELKLVEEAGKIAEMKRKSRENLSSEQLVREAAIEDGSGVNVAKQAELQAAGSQTASSRQADVTRGLQTFLQSVGAASR
jgi:hypothetical protein